MLDNTFYHLGAIYKQFFKCIQSIIVITNPDSGISIDLIKRAFKGLIYNIVHSHNVLLYTCNNFSQHLQYKVNSMIPEPPK